MGCEWPLVPIRKMAAVFDGPHATPRKTADGPVFLGISSLQRGRLDLSNVEYLSDEDFRKWTKRVTPSAGDVVFSYETRIGEAALIPANLRCCLGRRMALVRTDQNRLRSGFFLYYFLSDEFQGLLKAKTVHGSTVDRILLTEFPDYPVRVPPLHVQDEIFAVLSALDDKIALNRETNATLEAIAQAIFKSWFVDFDPVRAKMEGREPEGMDAETAALFPSEFVDSELGLIPKGWRTGTLGEICTNRRDGVKTDQIDAGSFYIGLEHMPRRSISLNDWSSAGGLESGKFRFSEGDILFGKLRPYFHKVGPAPLNGVCSTDILVIRAIRTCWYGLALSHLSSVALIDYADKLSNGAKMPRTNWNDLSKFPIVIPNDNVSHEFAETVGSLVQLIRENILGAKSLAQLRDTLLPKLISGQLRIPEAEELAEDALSAA